MPGFAKTVLAHAKKHQKTIVFPEPEDVRVLKAAVELQRKGIVIPLLIGDPLKVAKVAQAAGVVFKEMRLIDPKESPLKKDFATLFHSLRKHKGVTPKQAKELVQDPMIFAGLLVREGFADGMIAGSLRPSKDTIRAAVWCVGTRKEVKTASSVFFMEFKQELLVFGDCSVVIDPTAEQLAEIAIESVKTAKDFGVKPRVAMLSFSTHGSASHPLVDKVAAATIIARKKLKGVPIDGELQFDAAYVPEVLARKAPKSPLKGKKATVFIFPDLDSGNIGYKIAQRFGKGQAYGPILQGFQKPVNDLSRGCTVEEIVMVAAITAIQADHADKKRRR
jgi:phosphate acetyltransferase